MTTAILAAKKLLQQPASGRGGPAFVALAAVAVLYAAIAQLAPGTLLRDVLLATTFTALATGAGAVPLLAVGRVSPAMQSGMLGFGGGVMLAAAAFSLIAPALDISSAWVVACGVALGAAAMMAIDRRLPHAHTPEGVPEHARGMGRVWLVVFAIALHNIPEGLAVGVSYGSGAAQGTAVTLGIAAQNLPEGLVVAWAMRTLGYSPAKSAVAALATGLMEPLGGLLGVAALSISSALLPWGLAFAAGAMIFVVSHEIIPESHRLGREGQATAGVTIGFIVMLLLIGALA